MGCYSWNHSTSLAFLLLEKTGAQGCFSCPSIILVGVTKQIKFRKHISRAPTANKMWDIIFPVRTERCLDRLERVETVLGHHRIREMTEKQTVTKV